MKKNKKVPFIIAAMSFCAFSVFAESDLITTSQPFSVKLGATRVIYYPKSSGAFLNVSNPQDYPILVQSQVLEEDGEKKAPFVVTPPLMRLNENQSTRLRIIRTGGEFSADRESLKWICVKGIPPEPDDAWNDSNKLPLNQDEASMNIKLSINSCIKLFIRPSSLKGRANNAAKNLRWERLKNGLKAYNDTPFYINLSSLKVNGEAINKIDYIPPFSSREFIQPIRSSGGKIEWKAINDHGGQSRIWQADIK